jgi:protease I
MFGLFGNKDDDESTGAQSGEQTLAGKRVAVLVSDNFEQVELTEPRKALESAGAEVKILSPEGFTELQGLNHLDPADKFNVDGHIDDSDPSEFDAVLIPGGVVNSDYLRAEKPAQKFIQEIDGAGKPIAVICHGPWLLVSAGLVRNRTITSYHTLEDDIDNAGGNWADGEAVAERNWVSARNPDDLPAFCDAMVKLFAGQPEGGMHAAQGANHATGSPLQSGVPTQ